VSRAGGAHRHRIQVSAEVRW